MRYVMAICQFVSMTVTETIHLSSYLLVFPPGEYSCLRVDLVFARELSFYVVTIYIPCFMIVVVSWFSFWLDYKAVCLFIEFLFF